MTDFSPIVEQYKSRYDIRVRKWRRTMTGCAWCVYYHDGRAINWVESPYPKTPLSLAIFLHEVGHHVIGFKSYRMRCEEEYHAWRWAIGQMRHLGIEPDAKVDRRYNLSMQYAVSKAMRRGLKNLPENLRAFLPQAA